MSRVAPLPAISLSGVGFRHYGASHNLFADINLKVEAGDRLLITGASGSGKSTLLGLMTGLVPRFWPGEVEGEIRLAYARAGMVLQNPEAQLVSPTVYEEIAFALENRGWSEARIRAKVDLVIEQSGLGHLARRRSNSLSGGEAQRLSLACAIAQDPDVLFLDEPTAYLDPDSAHQFFANLALKTEAAIWVMVEHRSDEIRHLVNRALHLERGVGGREVALETACAPYAPNRLEATPDQEADLSRMTSRFQALPTSRSCSLRLENFSHRYESAPPVLRGLSGEALAGQVTAIMGPSGSGKTTILKKLAGLLPVGSGQAWLGDQDLGRLKPRQLASHLLLVPQNPEHFFLSQTIGREWELSGASAQEIQAACRLFQLDLDPLLSPALLSEGEKRRLNLALACLDPRPIILLDEPSYGLDRASFAALALCLRLLAKQGRTIVVVTHAPELAQLCADKLYRLADGDWRETAI